MEIGIEAAQFTEKEYIYIYVISFAVHRTCSIEKVLLRAQKRDLRVPYLNMDYRGFGFFSMNNTGSRRKFVITLKMRQVDLSAAKHLLIVSPDMLFRGLLIAFITKYILETLTGI